MQIAFHFNKNSFCERWLAYCKKNDIKYKLVNCYDSNILEQLADCDALMFHWMHFDYRAMLFMKQLTIALEKIGKIVFPNFNSSWHFDDKIAQKYLLEGIGAPCIPSYVFYELKPALDWCETTSFPKVFKLRGGAGSTNVKLVENITQAKKIIKKMFSDGFSQFDRWGSLLERYRLWQIGKIGFQNFLKGFGRLFVAPEFARMYHREKGYVYFQDFVPMNDSDLRVVVVGNRAFAIKRLVRKGDFRASGSGFIVYDKNQIDERCVKIGFQISEKLQTQSLAFDFIFNEINEPLLIEISYGFAWEGYEDCPGYWMKDMRWIEGKFNAQEFMVEDIIDEIYEKHGKGLKG